MEKLSRVVSALTLASTVLCLGVLLHMNDQLLRRPILLQSITTEIETDRGKSPITTNRYDGESVEEWLAEHQRALDRAAKAAK